MRTAILNGQVEDGQRNGDKTGSGKRQDVRWRWEHGWGVSEQDRCV